MQMKIEGDSQSLASLNETEAKECIWSRGGFVEYRPSTSLPVVLSAPHGGDVLPASVADRTSGCIEPDWLSWELAEAVWTFFKDSPVGPPAMVRLKLHRKKLEANRCRAASHEPGSEDAAGAWDTYHGWLEEALKACVLKFGFCLLLDLHGQSHREGVTELGYLWTSDDLLLSNAELDKSSPRPSSIGGLMRGFSARCGCEPSLSDLVRGPKSLGALLCQRGVPCTPSPEFPKPVSAEALAAAKRAQYDIKAIAGPPAEAARAATYFWGAYSVRRYGAADTIPAGNDPLESSPWTKDVAAVQLETSWAVRQDGESRKQFAQSLFSAVEVFLQTWKGWQPTRKRKAVST